MARKEGSVLRALGRAHPSDGLYFRRDYWVGVPKRGHGAYQPAGLGTLAARLDTTRYASRFVGPNMLEQQRAPGRLGRSHANAHRSRAGPGRNSPSPFSCHTGCGPAYSAGGC